MSAHGIEAGIEHSQFEVSFWGWAPMKDYQTAIERLRRDAAEAALIRHLGTDMTKREMLDRLHQHLNRLADEVEQTMKTSKESG